jgi:hypothetical protein
LAQSAPESHRVSLRHHLESAVKMMKLDTYVFLQDFAFSICIPKMWAMARKTGDGRETAGKRYVVSVFFSDKLIRCMDRQMMTLKVHTMIFYSL